MAGEARVEITADSNPALNLVDLGRLPSEESALALVGEEYAREHRVLPLRIEHDGTLLVAFSDHVDPSLLHDLRVLTRFEVQGVAATPSSVQEAITQRYKVFSQVDRWVEAYAARNPAQPDLESVLALGSESSPVVQIVDRLISQGLRDRASDIHIEPQRDKVRVRFRVDGILVDAVSLPKAVGPSICSRLKVMANMDIVDRHRAQDGQIRIDRGERHVDIRVSTAETLWGEKVVLRLLDQARTILSLHELGLNQANYSQLRSLLHSPYGMIVVSGPTGSGKTTSLYAAIKELDPVAQNITTIEDPVEYTFDNINQIQIRKVANLSFANGLRAILRQDPDVILVGEIRDLETAEIAVQSALTGHLVLSSLHATDAAGVIQRFIEMGIEGFLVSSSLIGVVAQRLVRCICAFCREPYAPSVEEMALWRQYSTDTKKTFYHGRGCEQCAGTGYRGRVGVFEVLRMTDDVKRMVSLRASAHEINARAIEEGMLGMRADAVSKVAADVTTLSEVIRCVWLN